MQQHRWLTKQGQEIWVEVSYAAVRDGERGLVKAVALVRDITAEKQKSAGDEAQIAAVGRVMAVAELALDGTILRANENLLKAFGYAHKQAGLLETEVGAFKLGQRGPPPTAPRAAVQPKAPAPAAAAPVRPAPLLKAKPPLVRPGPARSRCRLRSRAR